MMIEQQIFSAISPHMDIFYAIAPARHNSPYLVYTLISEVKSDVFCGQADTTSTFQLDSYAPDPLHAKKQAQKAFNLLHELHPGTVNASATYEDDTGLFRYQIEFSVMY